MFDEKKDQEIIKYVKENENITIGQLTKKFDISQNEIWKARELLFQNGLKLKKKEILSFTDEDVITRFESELDFKIRDLSLMYSVSPYVIKDILREAGINFTKNMFIEIREDIIEGYNKDFIEYLYSWRYSPTDIAKKYNVDKEDVCKILNISPSSGKRPLFYGGR